MHPHIVSMLIPIKLQNVPVLWDIYGLVTTRLEHNTQVASEIARAIEGWAVEKNWVP